MEAHRCFPIDRIERVMEADTWARNKAKQLLHELNN